MTTDHTDTYALAGPRACVLTYPPDLSAAEVDGVTDWLTLIVRKLGRIATPAAALDALRRNELADADAHLADANARCDRLKAEKGELEAELAHQRKLVETLCERVAAQSELLSQRAAKPKRSDDGRSYQLPVSDGANGGSAGDSQQLTAPTNSPKVTVIDDPEADLPDVTPVPAYPVLDPAKVEAAEQAHDRAGVPAVPADEVFAALLAEPYPSVPAVVESDLPEVLKNGYDHDPAPQTCRDDKGHVPPGVPHGNSPEPRATLPAAVAAVLTPAERRTVAAAMAKNLEAPPAQPRQSSKAKARATRLKIAAALVAKPLTAREIETVTGIPQGALSGALCLPFDGWWRKQFAHRGSRYELTAAGRAALRAAGIDAPDPPQPPVKGIDRDRERCRLLAEEMARLVSPQPEIVLAGATGWDRYDVETCLARHPELFTRAEGAREKWKLTAQGRELANEQEAA